jgi:signal transduction histidine kinase
VNIEFEQMPPLPAAVEVAAFRITTEAVTNVVRHAGATCCQVCLAADGGVLRIVVSDNGRGLRSGDGPAAGNGLQTMRERAEELRGQLRISSTPGNGTTVTAEIPLPPTQRQPLSESVVAVTP